MKKDNIKKTRKKLSIGQAYAIIVPLGLFIGYVVACVFGTISQVYSFVNCRKWYADIPGGLEYYAESKEARTTDYNVYSDSEIAEDGNLASVVLHYFPAENQISDRYVLICPGGAYSKICIDYEGYPLAQRANELGITAFILEYRVADAAKAGAPFAPIDDLANAIKFIKANKTTFGVGDEYSLCGFSAGANLVGLFGTEQLGYNNFGINKPSSLIMGYPWCYSGENTNSWNMFLALVYNVSGNGSKDVLGDELKPEDMYITGKITTNYPTTYLVQGTADMLVHPQNTADFYDELQSFGIQSKLILGENMSHGFGIAKDSPIEGWFDEALFFGL